MVDEERQAQEVRTLMLKSSDGYVFVVDKAVARLSPILKFVIEETIPGEFIPLINISGHTFATVIEYCQYHAENDKTTLFDTLEAWDACFIDDNKETVGNLMHAADYLHLENLLQQIGEAILVMVMNGKHPEEVLGRESVGVEEVLRKLHRII